MTATDKAPQTTPQQPQTTRVYRIYIKATPQAIWDAITKSEWTEKYGYGGRSEIELKPGGTYKGYASDAMRQVGVPDVAVEGQIIEADPPRKLVQTWHPVWDPGVSAETHTRLTWEIDEEYGVSRLTLTHDLTGAPLAAAMVAGEIPNAGGGWTMVLSDLKTLLETGKAFAG